MIKHWILINALYELAFNIAHCNSFMGIHVHNTNNHNHYYYYCYYLISYTYNLHM